MSVRRCQQEVSSAEFGEWLALWQLEDAADEPDVGAKLLGWAASAGQKPGTVFSERRG
jgi:hypothetical protein